MKNKVVENGACENNSFTFCSPVLHRAESLIFAQQNFNLRTFLEPSRGL